MENIKNKMIELNNLLKEASYNYYQKDIEIMSNFEYDKLYDELVKLEKEYGILLDDSITQEVGSEVVSELIKERHEEKALSLDKTKLRSDLLDWLGDNNGVLSWKLDGLTVVVTYENGKMTKAVTRGNGEIGEVITHNAKYFIGLPKKISYTGKLVIRGEALITYEEFERINSKIKDADSKYKNPRNLASGTIRQLDSKICKERNVNLKTFELVSFDEDILNGKEDTFVNRFEFLSNLGFDVVEHFAVNKENLIETVDILEKRIKTNVFPSDGLVLFFDDIKYGKSLGTTAKFPRNGIAFKWKDQTAETKIVDVIWQASRTGLINPVAVFEPVELEGTTVSKASAHNVSILKKLKVAKGNTINVYKANMIIPTILECINEVNEVTIPDVCPVCKKKTTISKSKDGIETLICENENCLAKLSKRIELFVSRNAMNIEGISSATIDKFIEEGFIKNLTDIYNLEKYKEKIINMEGFGNKSYENMINSLEKSKTVHLYNFLYAIGIPNIGLATAKDISKILSNEKDFLNKLDNNFNFSEIENIGEIINDAIYNWYNNKENVNEYNKLCSILTFVEKEEIKESNVSGKTFVITGSLNTYENRDALKEKLERMGAKVAGSVSTKTDYLVNNDITSNSSKNKKAKELGVKIITEEELNKMF